MKPLMFMPSLMHTPNALQKRYSNFSRALSCAALVLLTACTQGSASTSYDITMDIRDNSKRQMLVEQSLRVIERRLERMGDVLVDSNVTTGTNGARLDISAETQEALDALTTQLQEPFSLQIMAQAPQGDKGEIVVDGHGGFNATGITGDDLEWVMGRLNPETNTGEVQLVFTPEGRRKMGDLFKAMKGKYIGLFVRGALVSKLQVDSGELKEDIIIREIPTPELAIVFADDVNVGIHVTFTPVP